MDSASTPPAEVAGPPRPDRPTALTTLCVLTIVLGALGALVVLQSLAGLAIQFSGGTTIAAGPGVPPAMAEVQAEMESATRAVMMKYLPLTAVAIVLQTGLCAALIYGGVRTLQLREQGRDLLLKTFLAALIVEPIRTLLNAVSGYAVLSAMQPFMTRMMEAMSPPGKPAPAGLGSWVGQMMYVVGVASIVISFVWLIAKIGFFLWGRSYLRRAEIAPRFR